MIVARLPAGPAPEDSVAAAWVYSFLSGRRSPWYGTCLRRSAVLYFLLRSSGRAVELCIGVRRDQTNVLRAHAWLVRDGAIYLESEHAAENTELFSVIARFPSGAPRPA